MTCTDTVYWLLLVEIEGEVQVPDTESETQVPNGGGVRGLGGAWMNGSETRHGGATATKVDGWMDGWMNRRFNRNC